MPKLCKEIGHKCVANEYYNEEFYLQHADKRLCHHFLTLGDSSGELPPMGDSRDMCPDCQRFFMRLSQSKGLTIVISATRSTSTVNSWAGLLKTSRAR